VSPLPADHFEDHYRDSDDPWNYAGSWYEQRKYQLTVASLPNECYRSAFEPGCSIGVLTERLAPRCQRLLAADMERQAVDLAGPRVKHLDHVEVVTMRVPDEWPTGRFDLIVLSEFGYYLDPVGLDRLFDATVASLETGGHVVAVHWRGHADDYLVPGDAVHERLLAAAGLDPLVHHVEDQFRLDVLERR